MPLFEYLCDNCGKNFTELVPASSSRKWNKYFPCKCGKMANRIPSVTAWRPDKTVKP